MMMIRDINAMCGVQFITKEKSKAWIFRSTNNNPSSSLDWLDHWDNNNNNNSKNKRGGSDEEFSFSVLGVDTNLLIDSKNLLGNHFRSWNFESLEHMRVLVGIHLFLYATCNGSLMKDQRDPRIHFKTIQNEIATKSKRGIGNAIVGCEEGIEKLGLVRKDLDNLKIIKFKTGEILSEPCVLLGYQGVSKFDTGLVLALSNKKGTVGSFIPNKTDIYWTRII